jgi:hypothetical protein
MRMRGARDWLVGVALLGSLAPHMQNFTLTVFLPVSPRRRNPEIINESMSYKTLLSIDRVTGAT